LAEGVPAMVADLLAEEARAHYDADQDETLGRAPPAGGQEHPEEPVHKGCLVTAAVPRPILRR
jgi:hypothetical protein